MGRFALMLVLFAVVTLVGTMHPALVGAVDEVPPASRAQCHPSEFVVSAGTHCVSCDYCSVDRNNDDCVTQCRCDSSEQCGAPIGFCAITVNSSAGEKLCRSCFRSCLSREQTVRVLPNEEAVPENPHCAEWCLCRGHKECGHGRFCRRVLYSKVSQNLCDVCDGCLDVDAVGQCPRDNCAATMECTSHEECASKTGDPSTWCTTDHKCQKCSGECFSEMVDRDISPYQLGKSITGSCPKACCNWIRGVEWESGLSWNQGGPLRLSVSVCEPQRHSNFAAFWAAPGDGGLPVSADAARAAGWHECAAETDTISDGYPKVLTRFVCHWIEKCKNEERRLLVFADVDGHSAQLHAWSGRASGYSYECDFGQLISIAIGVGIVLVLGFCASLVYLGRLFWKWLKRKRD
jgi:hypothetical protein